MSHTQLVGRMIGFVFRLENEAINIPTPAVVSTSFAQHFAEQLKFKVCDWADCKTKLKS